MASTPDVGRYVCSMEGTNLDPEPTFDLSIATHIELFSCGHWHAWVDANDRDVRVLRPKVLACGYNCCPGCYGRDREREGR